MILQMARCSFCHKAGKDLEFLVACPEAMICEACAQVVLDLVNEERDKRAQAQARENS